MRRCLRSFVLICVAMSVTATIATAAEIREIELIDGSIIAGEVVSLSKGIYTVKTASLGTVRIEESKVLAIRRKGTSDTTGGPGGQLKSLDKKMRSSDEIMDMVQSLKDDPDFQLVLQDPEIMKAVQTGDIQALMANPRFMNLLNKQVVQQIRNRLSQ